MYGTLPEMMNNRVSKVVEPATAAEERILIVTPRPQDVAAIGGALAGAGLQPVTCENLAECCRQIPQGAGVVLLAEEALDAAQMPALLKLLEQQPPWSDLPILLLASRREAGQGGLGLIEQLNGAVTVLEQPMRGRNLLATVEMALRVRRHQYQFRDLMAERERNAREEKARREELEVLLDNIPAGVGVWMARDPEGRSIIGNKACYEMLRLPPGTDLSKTGPKADRLRHYEILVNGKLVPPSELPLQRVCRTGQPLWGEEMEFRFDDGTTCCVLGNVVPLLKEDGSPRGALGIFIDITARKRAEEELRRRELQYRALAEHSLDGIVRHDRQTRHLYANETVLRALGRPREAVIGKRLDEVGLPEELVRKWSEGNERVFQTGRPEIQMFVFPLPEGPHHFHKVFAPEFGPDGSVESVLHIGRDVDELIKAHEEVERTRQEWERTFDSVPDLVMTLDAQHRIKRVNRAMAQRLGLTPEQCIGQICYECVHGVPGPPEYCPHSRTLADGQLHACEMREERLQGDFLVTTTPLLDEQGRMVGAVHVARDITARRRAEEALRQSEERLKLVIQAAKLGTWDWDLTTGNITCSARCLALFGLAPDTRISYERFLETLHPEDRARIDTVVHGALERREDYDAEMRTIWPDGSLHWVAARGRGYYGAAGQPVRMSGVAMDITLRKQAEEALRQAKEQLAHANEELEQRVRERTAKLQEMVGELEHFSYSITHDMRAPLRAMRGFAGLLLEPPIDISAEMRADFLQRIATSAERMDRLITDALDYNKAVRQEPALAPVDVDALLRSMLASYPDFQPPRAQIRIEGTLPKVLGNEAALTQCLSNLLGNAVKFVQPGQVPQVRVWAEGLRIADCGLRIWFEDNGIGIAPEYQRTIFDMFQRLSPEYEGTGIGLALVRKVMERMGGKVGVESEPGNGSRFWLDLKACPGEG